MLSGQDNPENAPNYEIIFSGGLEALKENKDGESKASAIIQQLIANTMAKKLTLSILSLNGDDWLSLAHHLQERAKNEKYVPIETLNLTGISIDSASMQVIADELLNDQKYRHLKSLNLSQTGLRSSKQAIKARFKIARMLINDSENTKEKEKEKEKEGEGSIMILCQGLQRNRSLEQLLLSKNRSIDDDSWNTLLQTLSRHPKLKALTYNSNDLSLQQCRAFSDFLGQTPNPVLKDVTFDGCNINDAQLIAMCPGIRQNTSLKHFRIPNNPFTDEGIKILCQALRRLPLDSEKELHVDESKKDDNLSKSSAMRLLYLSGANISEKSGEYLGAMLAGSYHMEVLDLSFNSNFGDKGVSSLCEGLLHNESLIVLNVGSCNLSNECCTTLGKVLAAHSNLASLSLQKNIKITEDGMMELQNGIRENTHLVSLDLQDLRNIAPKGWRAFSEGLVTHVLATRGKIQYLKRLLSEYNCGDDSESPELIPDDVITYLIEWVGYRCLQKLALNNCFETQWDLGVQSVSSSVQKIRQDCGHTLNVTW